MPRFARPRSARLWLLVRNERTSRLFELEFKTNMPDNSVVLRFLGSCRNDGTKLSPENIIYMLEKVTNCEFELLTVHRQKLILNG